MNILFRDYNKNEGEIEEYLQSLYKKYIKQKLKNKKESINLFV